MSQSLRDRRVTHAHAIMAEPEPGLIGQLGALDHTRVLVLGPSPSAVLSALAGTACRHAEGLRPGCRASAGSADLVLVPDCGASELAGIVRQASIILMRGGRVVFRLPRIDRRFAHDIRVALVMLGFRHITETRSAADRFLHADAISI